MHTVTFIMVCLGATNALESTSFGSVVGTSHQLTTPIKWFFYHPRWIYLSLSIWELVAIFHAHQDEMRRKPSHLLSVGSLLVIENYCMILLGLCCCVVLTVHNTSKRKRALFTLTQRNPHVLSRDTNQLEQTPSNMFVAASIHSTNLSQKAQEKAVSSHRRAVSSLNLHPHV